MKKTNERLKALDTMVLAVEFFNEHHNDTGYHVERTISEDGKYVGTVSEGDFLYYMVDLHNNKITGRERHHVSDIIRKEFNPAVRIDVTMEELLNRALNQNFVPVVDDLGTFIGIVTRQDIMKHFIEK